MTEWGFEPKSDLDTPAPSSQMEGDSLTREGQFSMHVMVFIMLQLVLTQPGLPWRPAKDRSHD